MDFQLNVLSYPSDRVGSMGVDHHKRFQVQKKILSAV